MYVRTFHKKAYRLCYLFWRCKALQRNLLTPLKLYLLRRYPLRRRTRVLQCPKTLGIGKAG